MTRRLRSRLITIILLAVGVGTCIYGLVMMLDAWASRDWPSAAGTVESAEVDAWHQSTRAARGDRFQPIIRYAYEVEGTRYTGDRRRFGEKPMHERAKARAVTRRYPAGSEIQVYYEPSDPANAVPEPGLHPHARLIPGFGVSLVIAGGIMIVRDARSTP